MKRSDGERIRIAHQITNLRGLIDGFESSVSGDEPLAASSQSIANSAALLMAHANRFDAYQWAESDALPPVCDACKDTHLIESERLGRSFMCTRCPRPCRKCANDEGRGAYCVRPRCACECHKEKR